MTSPARPVLVVDLQLEGASWELRYASVLGDKQRVVHRRTVAASELDELGSSALVQLKPDALRGLLSGASGAELGNGLCKFLFGDAGAQATLFGNLFGSSELGNVNVLIAGEDQGGLVLELRSSSPRILEQPWHLLAYRSVPLVDRGWEIYCAGNHSHAVPLEIALPPTALLIAPELDAAAIARDAHVRELERRFEHFGTTHLSVVRTLDELRALADRRWQIVYYYGHAGRTPDAIPALLFGHEPGAALALTDLAPLLDRLAPSVVYVNACGAGAGGWFGAGNQLGGSGRLVLANLCVVEAEHARKRANRFFERLLNGKESPLACFCPDASDKRSEEPEWYLGAIHTSARQWRYSGEPVTAASDDAWALRLDRKPQRSSVFTAVNVQLKSPSLRRGLAFIALGAESSHIDKLSRQLLAFMRDGDSRSLGARSIHKRVRVPAKPDAPEAWDDELRAALEAQSKANLAAAARNFLSQRMPKSDEELLLWLDFDIHPLGQGAFPLDDWLDNCRRWSSHLQVEGLRFAFFAGFRGANDQQCQQTYGSLGGLVDEFATSSFGLELLAQLGPASYSDILDLFLESADLALTGKEQWVADRILDQCDAPPERPRPAPYDRVIAALREGRRTRFSELLQGMPGNDPKRKRVL